MPIQNTDPTTPATTAASNKCLDAFLRNVTQELTVACQLPVNIPKKEIIRIVHEAKKWFYKNYEYSVEEKFMLINSTTWTSQEFKTFSEVTLIDEVYSVHSVFEIGRDSGESAVGRLFNNDPDFSIRRYMAGSQGGKIGMASDQLMHYVVAESFYDMTRHILINKMSYAFNFLTHKFRFLGELPKNHVILQVYTKIDDCSLFDDDYFFRYVVAQAKMQLSRVLGTFNYNLPGNITVNYDLIRSEGTDELAAIKEDIKSEEGTDFFFTS